jgi:ABC-type sugar transport system permease subunit
MNKVTEGSPSGTEAKGMPAGKTPRAPRSRLSPEEHQRKARLYKARRALTAYAFLAPNMLFFVIFLLIPIIWVFWFSLRSGGLFGPMDYVGFDNWKEVLTDPLAVLLLKNTLKYALIAIPSMLILGMIVALLLRNIGKAGAIFRGGLYFPVLAPVVVAGLIWVFMVHPDFGAVNLVIQFFGGEPPNFLGTKELALPTVAVVEIWRGVGFWAVFFLAALVGLPSELYEAAYMDGTNAWQRFRYITLPLLRPTILFALVIATIYNVQIFDSVFVMTDGGPANSTATIVWYIYMTLFRYSNVGYGAALSVLLLALILSLTLILMRLMRGRKES